MSRHFHFDYGWWQQAGWRQFKGWLRELRASQAREAGRNKTSPDSWAGREHDSFWGKRR